MPTYQLLIKLFSEIFNGLNNFLQNILLKEVAIIYFFPFLPAKKLLSFEHSASSFIEKVFTESRPTQ